MAVTYWQVIDDLVAHYPDRADEFRGWLEADAQERLKQPRSVVARAHTNYQHIVAQLAAQHEAAWRNAHTGNAQTEDFIRLLAANLHSSDPSVGLNGKRGNPDDISDDALAVFDPAGDVTDRSGQKMLIIDCIIGAGGPNPSPGWSSVGGPSPGAWVQPAAVSTPGPTPIPGAGWEPKHAELLARFPAQTSPSAAYVRRVAEQFAFSFPGEGWGHKSAGAGRPPSTDVMARQAGSTLAGYKIIPQVANPALINLTGQHFISVTPTNHLGVTGGPTPIPQPQPGGDVPYPGADESIWDRVGEQLFADYSAHGQPPNPGMFRWAARVCWTAANSIKRGEVPVAAIQAAIMKHRGEWLAVLSAHSR